MTTPAEGRAPQDAPESPSPRPDRPAVRPPSSGGRSLSESIAAIAERDRKLGRHAVPVFSGPRLKVLGLLGVVTLGGVIYTQTFGDGGPVKAHMEVQRREREERERERPSPAPGPVEAAPGAAPRPTGAGAPQAAPAVEGPSTPGRAAPVPAAPVPTPAPPAGTPVPGAPERAAGGSEEGITLAPITEWVGRIDRADPALRAQVRTQVLMLLALVAKDPAWRRVALLEAARLAPDAAPEEAPMFATLTGEALSPGLAVPGDAGAALIYLGALHDRGGPDARLAAEGLVLSEAQPLELRVAAARALLPEARVRTATALAKRGKAHPALLAALR